MPLWLKPTYIVIAVLVLGLGVQTWRLSAAHLEVAKISAISAHLVANVANARTEGVLEGQRQQKAAQETLDAQHRQIVAGLEADKARLQKNYDNTYSLLRDYAGQEKWGCLKEPLAENVLEQFRR